MFKNVFLWSLTALVLTIAPFAYAGKVELTTYYPAPYGEYSQLQATGKTNNNSDVALAARGNAGTGLVVTNANNVGIGTITPQATLDVVGEVKVGNTSLGCNSSTEGATRYNSGSVPKQMEFCDGSSWKPMGGSGGISGYEIVSKILAQGGGEVNGTVNCPDGKKVISCGFNFFGYNHEYQPMCYPSSQTSCLCYSWYGGSCYAVCANIG